MGKWTPNPPAPSRFLHSRKRLGVEASFDFGSMGFTHGYYTDAPSGHWGYAGL